MKHHVEVVRRPTTKFHLIRFHDQKQDVIVRSPLYRQKSSAIDPTTYRLLYRRAVVVAPIFLGAGRVDKSPVHRLLVLRRVDLLALSEPHRDLLCECGGSECPCHDSDRQTRLCSDSSGSRR